MQTNDFLHAMILTELEDAVGIENCSVKQIDKVTHSVDYYWLSRMWADRGKRMPEADFVVAPKDAQETSKVLKIANYLGRRRRYPGRSDPGMRRYHPGYQENEPDL